MKNNYSILKKILLSLPLILFALGLQAQPIDLWKNDTTDSKGNYPRYSFMELKFYYGGHLPTPVEEFNRTIELNPWTGAAIRYGWKADGRKAWHSWHNYPTYGFGLFSCAFIPAENIVGNPNGIYMWYNQPLWRWEKFQINSDLGAGISYNFDPFDIYENPNQTVIGSRQNVYFELTFEGQLYLNRRFDLLFGVDFLHFSNGRSRTPQYGMNLLSANAKFRYNFRPRIRKEGVNKSMAIRPELISHPELNFSPRWEFYLFLNGGVATPYQYYAHRAVKYSMGSTGFDVARHYSYSGKIGVGLDITYDESIAEKMFPNGQITATDLSLEDKLIYGVHLGHEYMVQRWTVVTQLGMILNKRYYNGKWYGRVGMRYDLTKKLFLRVALRIPDGFKADFIEFGGGFYFYKMKKK